MENKFTKFTKKLQDLFLTSAKNFSKQHSFFKRERCCTLLQWLQMVLIWIESNNPTLSSLVNLFKNYFGITISAQALSKKFNKSCVEFLMDFLEQTILMLVMESEVEPHGLLAKFTGTFIAVCTLLKLSQATKESFPGTGGKDKDSNTSGMKILLRVEASKGIIDDIHYSGATTSDVKLYEKTKELPKGSLELVDMGFASQDRLLKNNENNVFFVARIQSTSILYVNDVKYTLTDFLSKQNSDSVDVKCAFGSKKVPVRLEAKRLSEEDAKRKLKSVIRKAKKSKRKVSKAQKIACQWQIYITSISDDLCTQEEVITLYSVRWQIELIFKLWKSGLKFDESNGKTTERVLCEKLLKMIYLLIYHSIAILVNIGPVCERSHVQALNLFKLKAKDLLFLLPDNPEKLNKYILKTVKDISEIPKRSKLKKYPSTYDRLKNDKINNYLCAKS